MKNKIKFIALDLDGTLLSSSKEIDEETIDYLKLLKRNGYKLILASGRHYYEIESYSQILHLDEKDIVIACDGERVFQGNGIPIYISKFLTNLDILRILPIISRDVLIVTDNNDYFVIKSILKRTLAKIIKVIKKRSNLFYLNFEKIKLLNIPIEKIVTSIDDVTVVEKLSYDYSCHIIDGRRLEIKPKGVNKYTAMLELQKRGIINLDNLLFFGNDYNDEECFRYLPYSVAMKETPSELKSLVFYVTDSNNSQGILKALKQLLQHNIF